MPVALSPIETMVMDAQTNHRVLVSSDRKVGPINLVASTALRSQGRKKGFLDVRNIFRTLILTNQVDENLWTHMNLGFYLSSCGTGLCYPNGSFIASNIKVLSNVAT